MAGELMLINPTNPKRRKKSKRRTKRRKYAKRRRNPVAAKSNPRRRRTYRKRRRNPVFKIGDVLQNTIMPAATAAGGAIGIDVLMGVLPLPENLKTGPMRNLVKGAAAIGLGIVAANFVKPKTAELFVNGAMTVIMYDAGREMINRFMPDMAARMGLSGMGLYYAEGADTDDDDLIMGLGYGGAGYTGVDEEAMEGLGFYYDEDDESMDGLSLTENADELTF